MSERSRPAPTVDPARCVLCDRAYTSSSRPQWAFHADGRLAGTVHTFCKRGHADRARYVYPLVGLETPLGTARAIVWVRRLRGRRAKHPQLEWYAETLLTRGTGDTLNGEQRPLLNHWRRGPRRLTEEEAARVLEAYSRLAGEFRSWQAAVVAREAVEAAGDG